MPPMVPSPFARPPQPSCSVLRGRQEPDEYEALDAAFHRPGDSWTLGLLLGTKMHQTTSVEQSSGRRRYVPDFRLF